MNKNLLQKQNSLVTRCVFELHLWPFEYLTTSTNLWRTLLWFVSTLHNLPIKIIVVTYAQFDSNIRVLYIFLGFLKNTWKYLIQRPIFKPLYHYNVFKKILENTSFLAPSKNTRISYVTTMIKINLWKTHL
jgi:hypothetical protein